MMYKIVFTGGGTAGHVVPNIAVMQKTNKYFDKTYYIGSDSGLEKSLIKPLDIPFYSVPCVKFSRDNFLKNLKIPFSLMSGVSAAKKNTQKDKTRRSVFKGRIRRRSRCSGGEKSRYTGSLSRKRLLFGPCKQTHRKIRKSRSDLVSVRGERT